MNLTEYQKVAPLTMSPVEPLAELALPELNTALKMLLFGIGAAGEAGEVYGVAMEFTQTNQGMRTSQAKYDDTTQNKMVKELGDVLWYTINMAVLFDHDAGLLLLDNRIIKRIMADLPRGVILCGTTIAVEMMFAGTQMLESLKKMAFHRHPVDKAKLLNHTAAQLHNIQMMCELIGVTIEEVAERNITKLHARYEGGKFSPAGSMNKNESAE